MVLINKFPTSVYADDANFEIAYSYFLKGDNEKARTELLNMAIKFPQSQYVPKALITVGLAYYNDNKDNEALSILKKLVKDYENLLKEKPVTDASQHPVRTMILFVLLVFLSLAVMVLAKYAIALHISGK